jgi:hypothetical protein
LAVEGVVAGNLPVPLEADKYVHVSSGKFSKENEYIEIKNLAFVVVLLRGADPAIRKPLP